MADIKETIPFDFDELYTGLKTKFEDKGYDTAEGSNTSQLITAMAYLTSMLNMNTAVNINETILPLSRKLDNAKQAARMLGYEVAHKQSYRYKLTLTLSAGNHIIPKYSEFTADGKTYYYMGNRLEINDVADGFQVQIDVKEGTLYKFEDNLSTLQTTTQTIEDNNGNLIPQYYVDIPFIDVEQNGIEVFLTYYDTSGNLYTREEWLETKQFMIDKDTILDKEYIRMDDIEFHTPRIYFELAGVGSGIRAGSIVEINVLTTSGSNGGVSDISDPSVFSHSLDTSAEITGALLLTQGADEEEIQSIQSNAPLFHNSANRAITKNDYTSICNRHQTVEDSMVWGGDDEFPKSPGNIWFSFLPATNIRTFTNDDFKTNFTLDNPSDLVNWFVENSEIRSTSYNEAGTLIDPGIWDVLDNYKIPTLEFHNRHPIYLDFKYDLEILKYNIRTSKADIHQEMFDIINSCFTGEDEVLTIEEFETEYFHSNIEKRLDANLTDVSGFNTALTTQLLITEKNITAEYVNKANRDIFINLAVPFEDYFDNNGDLIVSKLPSIDTELFAGQYDVYTDWDATTSKDVDDKIIIADVRSAVYETETATSGQTTFYFNEMPIPEDGDISELEFTVYVNDVEASTSSITYDENGGDPRIEVVLSSGASTDDEVKIKTSVKCGKYYLFNDYRKKVIIQIYVNAEGYANETTDEEELSAEPKSYLTSIDGYYGYTTDDYYITTEGYVIQFPSDTNINTGPAISYIASGIYANSPIRLEHLVDNPSYLNFNYASPNFKVTKNIIPRLREVTFN